MVSNCLAPLLNNSYDCPEDVKRELNYVATLLQDVAEKSFPPIQPKKPQKWRDATLTALCAQSRTECRVWKENGYPSEGPFFDEKCRLRRAVRRRVRYCAARTESQRIQETKCSQLRREVVSSCLEKKPDPVISDPQFLKEIIMVKSFWEYFYQLWVISYTKLILQSHV